jgi:predicted AAA+ superfamily ATPase
MPTGRYLRAAVDDPGARFENLVGAQLLKYCHFVEDTEGWAMELRYLRDTDGREVDFVVMRKRKPIFAVECKVSDRQVDPSVAYFAARTAIPRFYLVHLGKAHFERGRVTVLPFARFTQDLGLP